MALGRGLAELLGEVETAYDNNNGENPLNICDLSVNRVKPNPYQPRKIFDKDKLQELSDSIALHGLLQPIVVTRDGANYILIAGERRLKATILAKIPTIKATVLDIQDNKLRELALIENIQRDDLNIIELAYSYAGLVNEHNITHEELAKIVSKSRSSVTNTLRLLALSVYAQQMLSSSKISAGHAKILIGLSNEEQKIIIDSIIGQHLNVRETEQLVRNLKNKEKENVTKKSNNKVSFKPLSNIINSLNKEKLSVTTGKDYLKIKLNSEDDVKKLLNFFTNL